MSDYIDRDKIFSIWRSIPAPASLTSLAAAISQTPTEDVVPVVRCKDCIWRGREECAMFYRCDCGEQHTWETDNDFCSYGERKEHANEHQNPPGH